MLTRMSDRRDALIEATIATLRERGFARTSSRAVAERAGANQALVFYYFGSFDELVLAALQRVSVERLDRYRSAVEGATSPRALVAALRTIYAEDVESGAVAVVSEVVAGSVAHPALGPRVVELMQPWVDLVESSVRRVLSPTPLGALVEPRELALAAVTFYLGANLVTRLDPEHAGIDGLLAAAEQALVALE